LLGYLSSVKLNLLSRWHLYFS